MTRHETSLQWVYFPPFLLAVLLGFIAAVIVTIILNRTGWFRYFAYPGLVVVALWVLMTSLLGLLLPP